MANARHQLGQRGEILAAGYLQHQGFRLIASNWRTRLGEIDLVMVAPDATTVFVEVKTRWAHDAQPLENITGRKQRILIAAAQTYLSVHELDDVIWRFDVIAVTLTPPPRIDHIPDAFSW
ncbi:MAG: YraN family protein [Chloroflexota bacterium]|nr:YraN family protein [Chloroflexota bacterium]